MVPSGVTPIAEEHGVLWLWALADFAAEVCVGSRQTEIHLAVDVRQVAWAAMSAVSTDGAAATTLQNDHS